MIHFLIRLIPLIILIPLPDHGDTEHHNEWSPGRGWIERTDNGNTLQDGNDKEIDVGQSPELREKRH